MRAVGGVSVGVGSEVRSGVGISAGTTNAIFSGSGGSLFWQPTASARMIPIDPRADLVQTLIPQLRIDKV